MHIVESILSEHLLGLIAEYSFNGGTLVADDPISLQEGHDIRGVLSQGSERLLATAQLARLLEFGDVHGDPDDSHQSSLLVMHGGLGNHGGEASAVLAPHHALPRPDPAILKRGHDLLGSLHGACDLYDWMSHHLFRQPTVESLRGLIPVDDPPLPIGGDECLADGFEQP